MERVIGRGEKEKFGAVIAKDMRRAVLWLILFALLVLSSCSEVGILKQKRPTLVSAASEDYLVGEKMNIDADLLMGGFLFKMLDDTSAVFRFFGTDHLLACVSFRTGDVRPIMFVGRGPAEMLDANFASRGYVRGRELLLDVFDTNEAVLKTIDIQKSMEAAAASIVQTRTMPMNCWMAFSLRDGYLFKVVLDSDGLSYKLFDNDDNEVKTVRFWKQGDVRKYYNYMSSADCVKSDGSKLAMCFNCLDKVALIDLNSNQRTTLVTDSKWRNVQDLNEMERQLAAGESSDYYLYATCDDESIYALYYPGDEVRVFSWAGEYKKRIGLDHQLICIDVSPDGSLFGVDMEGGIYRYDHSR